MRVTVTAKKAFSYQGRVFSAGDQVTMPAIDAAVQSRKGNVSLTRGYQTREVTPEAPAEEPTTKRRQYRRRDLVAEP